MRNYRYVIATALGTILWVSPAIAESIDVFGLPLEVDSVTSVDASLTKVTVLGESRLVLNKAVPDAVLSVYLNHPQQLERVGVSSLIELMERSVKIDATERAVQLLVALGSLKNPSLTLLEESLARLRATPGGSLSFFKDAALALRETALPRTLMADILLSASRLDARWVRETVSGMVYVVGDELRALAERVFVESALARKFEAAFEVARSLRIVLGEDDRLVKRLHAYRLTLESAVQADQIGNIDELYRLLDASRSDLVMGSMISPLAYEATLRVAENHINENRPVDALGSLTRIDVNQRTPRFHEIIRKALTKLTPGPDAFIENPQVTLMLMAAGDADSFIRSRHLSILDGQVMYLAGIDEMSRSEAVFNALRRVRPDPNGANNELRGYQALAYLKNGSRALAYDKLATVEGGLSVRLMCRLFFAGYYIPQGIIALLLVVSALGVITLLVLRVVRLRDVAETVLKKAPSKKVQPEEEEEEANPFADRPAFLGRGRNPLVDEYKRCLQVLELEPGVTIAIIKSTYRTAVKQHHPDLQVGNESASTPDRFIELTQAYERAVDLHRELGYP